MALDTLLLISCICIVIAVIFYFFHWNRFIAFLIGRGIRLLFWNKESSSIWVEIGSIHFSLVAGRILLKDVTYHSSNQTIKVVKGQLLWRYWIRKPTSAEEIGTILGGEDQKPAAPSMHCRIHVSFQGFEWFLYNRTAAYDDIISRMDANNSSRLPERRQTLRPVHTATSSSFHRRTVPIPQVVWDAVAWVRSQLPSLDPKDLLPLGIEVIKGAIICGNSSTQNLLVAEFQRTEGTFGIIESRSKFDLYKQILALNFQNALVRYVRNEDYVDPMTTMGELVHGRVIQYSMLGRASSYLSYRSFSKLWRRLRLSILTNKYSSDRRELRELQQRQRTSRSHKKSAKSTEDGTPIGADFSTLEYAMDARILEAPFLELSYYADVVGDVPECSEYISIEPIDIGNRDISPEWGFDIIISGGFLRYGPWADRQRLELQRAFFPPTYHDGEVTASLSPGDKRMWTALRMFIELRGGTTLQIPFREASKDWQWDGKAEIHQRQRVREPATFHLSVGDRSSINYTLPMVVGTSGYQPILDIHLDTVVVTSSLNDIRLVSAESCRVRCELPTPLKWNLERKWIIAISLRQPVLYLIRDHINMFIDLGRDWAAGPPSDYQRFIPMVYNVEFEMHHFELNLYANDHNIVDKPLIRDENTLFTSRGVHFNSIVKVPLTTFRPESTKISFTMEVPDPAVSLSLPRWNTNALYAPVEGNSLAKVGLFRINGSYQYFAEVRKEHVEQLKLKITARDIAFKMLGWSIRYFMVLRDNYFGSFTHFSTLYEYLDKRRQNLPPGDPVWTKYREGKSNMLQVELSLCVERGTVILPAGLPGYEVSNDIKDVNVGVGACVILTVPELQLQLRLHDYYMEMSLNVDAVSGGIVDDYPEKVTYSRHPLSQMKETYFINGLDITANRLFGPQPRTATYVCIWEIRLGAVKFFLSASDGRVVAAAGNAFRLNFADLPNAPASAYLPAIDPDVTFVKFSVSTLHATWRAGPAALTISLSQGVRVDTNDLGGSYHRRVTSLRIPEVVGKVLLSASTERNRWLEAAEVVTDVFVDIYASPRGYRDMSNTQIAYVEEQDRLTRRARRMLASFQSEGVRHRNGLYLPQPVLPKPPTPEELPLQQETLKDEQLSRLWPMSGIGQLSESDTEEGVSEADRDARLAKTRSSSPIAPFPEEDSQSMTSGDESDNEDLTDASSESQWFEFAGPPDQGINDSLFMRFSHVTRHYIARHLELPELWDQQPFILTKDRISLGDSETDHPTNEFRDTAPMTSQEPLDLNDDRDLTSYRFKCRHGVNVKITPLILPAATQFEADMESNPLGPELCIDSLMARYFDDLTASKDAESCTLFEVSVPFVAVRILQVIAMVDGHPTILPERQESEGVPSLDAVSVLRGEFNGVFASGISTVQKTSMKTGFDRFSLTLDVSNDKRTIPAVSPNDLLLSYDLRNFHVELVKESLSVIWEDSVVQLGLLGPEYMMATCTALVYHGKQLGALKQRWTQHNPGSTQTTVYDILRSSANNAILDPLSIIQPSYLVQTGTPRKLRTDTMFRLLFHLRSCLRRSEVRSSGMSDCSDLDLISLLESRLEALDQDTSPENDLSFLEPFFPGLRILQNPGALPTQSSYNPSGSMSLRFARLAIVVLDRHSQPSELAVTNMQLSAQNRKLEVFQLPAVHSMSVSQTSLKDKHSQRLMKASATMTLGDVTLAVFPHLMQFAQNVLWVRRHYHTPVSRTSANPDDFEDWRWLLSADVTLHCHHLRVQAAAENLIFEFGFNDMRGASSVLLRDEGQKPQSMNHSIFFSQIYIRAHSPADVTKKSDQDILASIDLTNGRTNIISRQDLSSKLNLRLTFSIGSLQLSVPRSALRLYRFVEEWRADYLPGIEATAQALMSEIRRAPAKPISQTTTRSLPSQPIVQVQGHLFNFGISLQVMHGTWLSWEVNRTTAYFHSSNVSASSSIYTFGLQVEAMDLIISSAPNVRDLRPNTRIKLVLPPLSITGHVNEAYVYALALIEFVELKVKPSHWDTLLAVQQKFGQDFNDLVTLVQETQLKKTAASGKHPPERHHKALKYSMFLKIRGFRVGLEGLSSTVHLECLDIGGGVNNADGLAWDVALSDLAFSLAPRTTPGPHPGFSRKHCSAFVIVDFMIRAGTEIVGPSTDKVVQVSITKIHAVMQPSSIGEVGDFIDHLQAELLVRKEQRAFELAAFKEKAQSILKTFEIGSRDVPLQEKSGWVDEYIINVTARNIGVAFPLTHDHDLELPQTGSRDSAAVRAFLFSIKLVEFGTHRGETGQAYMQSLSFQFIPRFRQSVASDFSGENHLTRNKLLYPEMKAQIRSTRSGSSRDIWVKATVIGFILDLDSSIPSYVFSLIDVYRQGKNRMEMLAATVPRTPSTLQSSIEKDLNDERRYSTPTSNVLASLIFFSGKVRVYSGSASNLYRAGPFSAQQELSDEQVTELGAEVFNLPAVSVWAEYRSTPASHRSGVYETEPSILMFKSTVHSSQNTLRPTLLPFLTELVSHVEARMRKASLRATHATSVGMPQISTTMTASLPARETTEYVSSMRISFSLRIDQSKLELTCQPDVNVIAGLHWDSGGFVVNISPGARDVSFSGSVGGLTLGLKHGFLSEDCVKLNARNLTFSLTFSKTSVDSLSLILDTEFLGVVRFSRLQDILCFKAVWLDRIPIFHSQSANIGQAQSSSTSPSLEAHLPKSPFSTIVLVRVRCIKLDIDLGQSISALTLDLTQAVMRTKLTELRSEVSVFVTELRTSAKGNIAGHAQVASCVFQTIRSSESNVWRTDGHNRMLELRMTSGPLTIALESDNQRLLHYRAEPLEIKVFDDWSVVSPGERTEEKLRLSFTVTSPEVIAVVTVGTIPKLMSYSNKFTANMDAQRQGASRESKAFRVTRTPKPENPLSAVAEAMLHSARSRFKEAESGFSHVIKQYMSLRLDSLRLVVFPRTMDDLEIAQFIGRDVCARLDRSVQSETMPGKRDLHLSFSSMTISKFSGLGHPQSVDLLDVREWLTSLLKHAPEAIIVGLPSMTMHMVSEETMDHLATNLVYDFHSVFVRREGMRDVEDIYITLNVALYSWLTLLRKNLTREMDQVKASTDWRALLNPAAIPGGVTGRKRPPSTLNLEPPSSPVMPDSGDKPFSPFSPTTALRSTLLDHSGASSPVSPSSPDEQVVPGLQPFPSIGTATKQTKRPGIVYHPRQRHIERLTMRQLGEATPDVMHPFFMKKAGFNLEDSLPQYVNEYATAPLEEVMEVLLKLYSRQLLAGAM